ncbi:hypothetical protein [Leuconostoc falkenbergense]|uniref:hypothetical protein n=1 Tax=Leuconostoc falkenbergense TaxID=2766470 RepID=UPI001968844C|nr:hypothetical protein [Leuconostoc falkenbergense]QSB52043.1 hypothetical protein I6J31_03490 [Leuconostoc falkenbergense]
MLNKILKRCHVIVVSALLSSFLMMPVSAYADTSHANINFADGAIDISVPSLDFGEIDVTSLQNNDTTAQFFQTSLGHMKYYQGDAKLVATDKRFNSRDGFRITASTDGDWYQDEDKVADVTKLALFMKEPGDDDLNMLYGPGAVVMDVDSPILGENSERNFNYDESDDSTDHINFGIFVPNNADVSALKNKTLTTTITWTASDIPEV